ncbi:MAG: DUF3077 domain-containing protein [Pseudomonas sp.]|uniref:DUF3077 domain-containing protein n=1 Tax=Pseudomonas sp. TaxID=306 RepID=UPI003D0CED5A
MIKIVPDPPASSQRPTTAHTQFGACHGSHPPLFAVSAGIDIEDALVHLAMSLKSAFETNAQVCEMADRPLRGLVWATQHSLEISQALVESLLSGVEKQHAAGTPRG